MTVAVVPAVVTAEQFVQVNAKLALNQSFAARNNKAHKYLLRALVSCGHCLQACHGRCLPHNLRYYLCTGKARAFQ